MSEPITSSSDSDRRKRYAIVGTGGRARAFHQSLAKTYRESSRIVALCDTNQTRMEYTNQLIREAGGETDVPTFKAADFDLMIRTTRPNVVIVTTIDATHHLYIIRAMELGCDVITEKPLTIDGEKCAAILQAVECTGRSLRVAFNYRYAPIRSKVKELLTEGAIGTVKSIHFEWLLDTKHGADYFRRWHRDKRNSGGLMVHKSTHHFDLVNWWLDSVPETVFAMGALGFYGRKNAEARGVTQFYERGTGDPAATECPFAVDLNSSEFLRSFYLNAEHEDGYRRDQSVFSEGISIEDMMNVLVRYRSGAQLSYTLHAFAPWEGYRIALNGDKGRIEVNHQERSYINAGSGAMNEGATRSQQLLLLPFFERPREIEVPPAVGGHAGGDLPMLEALFGNPPHDPLNRAANHLDGALSILTGVAANQSIAEGIPVQVANLLPAGLMPGAPA